MGQLCSKPGENQKSDAQNKAKGKEKAPPKEAKKAGSHDDSSSADSDGACCGPSHGVLKFVSTFTAHEEAEESEGDDGLAKAVSSIALDMKKFKKEK